MPSTLDSVVAHQRRDAVECLLQVGRAPVAAQRRVEHLAEPVQHDRPRHVVQQAPVQREVVVGTLAQRASARLAIRITAPPSSSTTPICSR
jgi:hypothetical protein